MSKGQTRPGLIFEQSPRAETFILRNFSEWDAVSPTSLRLGIYFFNPQSVDEALRDNVLIARVYADRDR